MSKSRNNKYNIENSKYDDEEDEFGYFENSRQKRKNKRLSRALRTKDTDELMHLDEYDE